MKIQKFLVGGAPSFLVIANPFAAPAEDSTTSSSGKKSTGSGKSGGGLLSESLLNELYKKGIPVDVDNFVLTLAKYEQLELWGLGVSSAAIRGLEAQANRIILQANYLNKAEDFAEKNASIGEIAVGSKGQLYTQDSEGNLHTVSMSEYDQEKHGRPLTVGDLIEQRKFNPSKAYDTDLTQTINNNIGMLKINEYIQGIIKTVGESATTSEAYIDLASYIGKEAAKRPTEEQLKSLLQLALALQSLGPEAIFKNKEVLKSKNIQEAFEYIKTVLPRDMRLQLSGRWVASGGTLDSSGKYMETIIALALAAANDTEYGNYLDYESDINRAAGKDQSERKRSLKQIELLILGTIGKTDYKITNKANPNLSFTLHGTGIGALTDYNNNIIPKSPITLAIQNSIGPLIDKNHITMGDQKVPESALESILYDGNDVLNIWAPVDSEGNIDLLGLSQFNEILDAFNQDPSLTTAEKNAILLQLGIDGKINEDGSFTGYGNMAQFLVFTGITSDEILNSNNQYAEKSPDSSTELDLIENLYGALNKKGAGIEFQTDDGWFIFPGSTDIYRAPIFMKLKPNAQLQVQTLSNHGPLVNAPSYEDMVVYDQLRYNKLNLTTPIYTPSSSILEIE